MSERRAVALLALVLTLAACENASPARSPRGEARVGFEQLRAAGDAWLAQRDWEGAVEAYRSALVYDPESLAVRYALGVALAYLERVDEAVTAFTWVADHGPAGREEVKIARQWLVEAGIRVPSAPASASVSPADTPAAPGRLEGRTEWTALDPSRSRLQAQILLEGDEPATTGRRYWARAPLNEPYRVSVTAPGRYRVMVQVGPVRLWDTTVLVEEGRATRLDLTPATSSAPPDVLRGS